MEEEVERPVCRTLFRQASHETRLDPTIPSDSEDEDDLHSRPRVVDVLVKQESSVKTTDQSTTAESKKNVTSENTSPTDKENKSSSSKSSTGKSDPTREHRVHQRCTQEKDRPATFHENELRKDVNISVTGEGRERPTTIGSVEIERFKQGDTTYDHQIESVGTLKGKTHKREPESVYRWRAAVLQFAGRRQRIL
jgi:hypothetical protein